MRMRTSLPAIVTLMAIVPGCQSLDVGRIGLGPELPKATPQNPVTEVVCLWEPAEGVGLDGLPTRGFAGQILFFSGTHSPEPVQVNGDVRIYVFDNHGTLEEQGRPFHQFDFPAEAWNQYLRMTNLGAAYQIFIPYTRKGGYAADCVLRVRMTPENGFPAYSKMSSVHLPGRSRPADAGPPAGGETSSAHVLGEDTARAEVGAAALRGIDALAMPINTTEITQQQPASLSVQRTPQPPDTRRLESAIADLLRERESNAASDGPADVEHQEPAEEPLTGRYNLAPRSQLSTR